MKIDLSLVLYQKYFSLKNRLIEIELKDKSKIVGKFYSFFRGEDEYGEAFITSWQIVDEDCVWDIDELGFLEGQIVRQKDIVKVKFFDDNSEMIF